MLRAKSESRLMSHSTVRYGHCRAAKQVWQLVVSWACWVVVLEHFGLRGYCSFLVYCATSLRLKSRSTSRLLAFDSLRHIIVSKARPQLFEFGLLAMCTVVSMGDLCGDWVFLSRYQRASVLWSRSGIRQERLTSWLCSSLYHLYLWLLITVDNFSIFLIYLAWSVLCMDAFLLVAANYCASLS